MRFLIKEKILSEEEIENNIIDTIFNDCKPFINELRNSNVFKFVIRNINQRVKTITLKKSYINDRKPKDVPEKIHNLLNKLIFKPKFGWNVRNGVFASGGNKGYYGEPYFFFPKGHYKYVWSDEVDDLYEHLYEEGHLDFLNDEVIDKNEILNIQKIYNDKFLKLAIRSENEISFNCKEYYLINQYVTDNFRLILYNKIFKDK